MAHRRMLNRSKAGSLLVALVLTPAAGLVGQTSNTTPAQPAIPSRPTVVAPAPAATPQQPLPARPERPPIPNLPPPAQESVKDLVRDFQSARQAFLNQQKELQRQLKTATEEQRALIREQLKENLQQWLEQQKAQIQDLREQARDIKNNVPALRDVIDSGGGEGRGR